MKSAILLLCALILAALPACAAVETDVQETAPAEVAEEATNMPAPTAKPTTAAGPAIYQMGIFAEPISRNYWNFYGGPAGSVWTGYVLAGYAPQLYGYSDQRFDWVPVVASDFPTDLKKETIDGDEFWTAEVPLKKGILWSDGEELTAADVVFTVNTVLDLQLGANWGSAVDRAFFENDADPTYFRTGAIVTQFENGALIESNERLNYTSTLYGEATGNQVLEYEVGPHVDAEIFSIYGNQDAAILALTSGDIDYVFNPLGLEKGFQDRIRSAPDLEIVTNLDNGVFYLGFNIRKAPMSIKEFRQAVATVIDKEFVAQSILQDAAIPIYSMVPEGNAVWHNPNVNKFGQGLSRGERLTQAVRLLKSAGFTYEEEPEVSDDGDFVSKRGKGLKMPDGSDVPALELVVPSPGYDPLRSTFAIWIERWLNELGVPTRANLVGFNVIVDTLFSDTVAEDLDMWILGWSLTIFPDYVEDYFHSRHAPENEEGGSNWGGYSNPEFDQMAFELLSETDIDGARDTVFQMQEFLAEELPYVTLFTIPKLDAYRPSRIEFPYTSVLGGLEGQGGMQQVALIK